MVKDGVSAFCHSQKSLRTLEKSIVLPGRKIRVHHSLWCDEDTLSERREGVGLQKGLSGTKLSCTLIKSEARKTSVWEGA